MPFIQHEFDGGWATAFGPQSNVPPENDVIRIPFLVDAENLIYELDGGPHKMPGCQKVSAELESGAVITGLYDFWSQGTGGSPRQRRIIHVGTKIKRDDADGNFVDLFTGMTPGVVPSYSTFDDLLITANDSPADLPKSWDGTNAQDLAGTPPNFAISVTHKNRSWAAGVNSTPSRLYFSENLDPEDWSGTGAGSIDIDPNDGDKITGIVSHRNELWVFKGPHRGSIHRISGSSPTGSDPFARTTFVTGLGAAGHNTLQRIGNDLMFQSPDGSIHSLAATDAFGDFNEAALSRPIQDYVRGRTNFKRLKHAWSVNCASEGFVLVTMAVDGSTNNNVILLADYRFNPPRWAKWTDITAGALATVLDNNRRPTCWAGSNDGFVRRLLQPARTVDDTTAISYKVTSPFLTYGDPSVLKDLIDSSIGFEPKNDGDVTLGWTRDGNSQQTATIAQGGGDVLGTASANQFTLGTSELSGDEFITRFVDQTEGGEFRAVQYQFTNAVNFEDVELHTFGSMLDVSTPSTENV